MSGALEYRVNSTGTWTTWLPVPETDSIDFEFSASFILPAGRCANYQLRGVAIAAGDYPFSIGWSRVGSEPVDGSVGLVVIPGTSIVPANDGPEQGISCLGVGEYGVRIVRRATPTSRGGVVGELTPYSGNWARLLNATSDASVRIPLRDRNGRQSDDCDILNEIRPWRHELEIHRSGHLVWAGPILNIKADPRTGQADISAKDLSAWWAKRFLLQDFNFLGTDLATIFEAYVNYTQLVDPYGLEVTTTPTGILGDRTVIGRSVLSAANELSELDRTGVDWTIANRTAFVGGTTINGRNSRIPTVFTDESFRDPPITRLSGDGQGNDWYVKGRSDDDLGRYTSPTTMACSSCRSAPSTASRTITRLTPQRVVHGNVHTIHSPTLKVTMPWLPAPRSISKNCSQVSRPPSAFREAGRFPWSGFCASSASLSTSPRATKRCRSTCSRRG